MKRMGCTIMANHFPYEVAFLLAPLFLILLERAPTVEACDREDIIEAYNNVLCRLPDDGGLQFWISECRDKPDVTEETIEDYIKGTRTLKIFSI